MVEANLKVQKGLDLEVLQQPKLGRLYTPDTRDSKFPLSAVLPPAATPDLVPERPTKYWFSKEWFDQGRTSQCVIYSGLHLLHDGPVTCYGEVPLYNQTEAYCWAQSNDEWDGDCGRHRYDGTSVRAGLKWMQLKGYIGEYRWALNATDAVLALFTLTPLQMGTWWRSGMWNTDPEGFVKYSGSYDGGHAWVANGVRIPPRMSIAEAVRQRMGKVRGKNSWGRDWGKRGYFWLSMGDFIDCFNDQGEAAIIREVDRLP